MEQKIVGFDLVSLKICGLDPFVCFCERERESDWERDCIRSSIERGYMGAVLESLKIYGFEPFVCEWENCTTSVIEYCCVDAVSFLWLIWS